MAQLYFEDDGKLSWTIKFSDFSDFSGFLRNFQTVKLASQVRRSQIESHRELRLRHQVVLSGCGSKLIDGWGTSKYI